MVKHRHSAFTLIELLIVISILGILAVIVVPNILNAQIRAKIARAQADMKAIENALVMYQADWGTTPFIVHFRTGVIVSNGRNLPSLTPYVAIDSINDPFLSLRIYEQSPWYYPENLKQERLYYEISCNTNSRWMIGSIGPDVAMGGFDNWWNQRLAPFESALDSFCMEYPNTACCILEYDTSNGLISGGDIHRFNDGRPDPKISWLNGKPPKH